MPKVSWLQRQSEKMLWKLIERRSSLENPQTPLSYPAEWLLDIFNGGRTDSGIRVSEMTALQADAVLACVMIISKGLASLPVNVCELSILNNRAVTRMAINHPLFWPLRLAPNEEMSSHVFRAVCAVHMLLWGNSYVEIQRDNAARVIALWPRNPARTRPVRLTADARIEGTLYPRGTLVYRTSETMGDEISAVDDDQNRSGWERIVLAEDMLHFVGLSLDGRLGQSTVYLCRQIIGLAIATEKYGAKFFGNGAVPRGIIEIPGSMEPKAIENLRRSWQEAHGGENAHKTAVLEQGVTYRPIGIEPEKSQFLETRSYQRKAIASIFQVPQHMVGEGEGSKSTVEQSSIEFLTYCIGPWIDVMEQEMKRKLFPIDRPQDKNFFVKFDTHRLLYPNADTRSKYYQTGKAGGWLNTNDIHEKEGMNPVEDGSGEIYWAPVNVVNAATGLLVGSKPMEKGPKPELPQGGAPQNEGVGPKKPNPDEHPLTANESPRASALTRYTRIFYPLFMDATGRVQNRREVDESSFRRCFAPVLHSLVETLSSEMAPTSDVAISSVDFHDKILAYLEGMRSNIQGVTPEFNGTYAMREVRRAIDVWFEILDTRYNPNHVEQPRDTDGKFHNGKRPLFLGRHGSTDDDITGVWSGWRKVTINAQGQQEIDATLEKLRGLGIKRIVSSNLDRAKHTAHHYANALGIPMTTDWRLNAWKLGAFEGMNEEKYADSLKLYVDNPDISIPDGESLDDYVKRTNEALDEIDQQNEESGPILVVTHSSVIASRLCGIKDLERSSCLLTPAGVVRLDGKKITLIAGNMGEGDAA